MSKNSDRKIQFFSELKKSLLDVTRDVFVDFLGLKIDNYRNMIQCEALPALKSARIVFHSEMVGSIVISVEEKLAQHIVRQMGLEILSKEEEDELIDDALGELLNTIAGNASNALMEHKLDIEIDPPQIIANKEDAEKMFMDSEWMCRFETSEGDCCLILLESEK